jgi:putative membrane protein
VADEHETIVLEPAEVDATRRTRLAAERTFLAWSRNGLTALAASLAAGKLAPDLAQRKNLHVDRWPYLIVGVGFAALGLAFMAFGYLRQRAIERALDEGRFARLEPTISLVLTGLGLLLGIITLVAVIVEA